MPSTGPAASNMATPPGAVAGSGFAAPVGKAAVAADATGRTPTGGGPQVDRLGQRRSRISTTTITTTTAAATGTTRLNTGAPAVRNRSTGSASGAWIVRALPLSATSLEAGWSPADDSTSRSRQATNWSRSLADTSAITPRPNWATLPVIVTSLSMLTRVPSPSDCRTAVAVADAFP